MPEDEIFMGRCFELARLGIGRISPNPPVGSVIVCKGRIIGEGWHQNYGGPHAEVHAFKSVHTEDKHLLSQSTMYVSLEPCAHFGKTPPCVDLVLKHKIKKVVISCCDPNPKVNGLSVAKMRAAGVEVVTGVLEEKGKWLARLFIHSIKNQRPYIILKFAQSKDGFMGQEGKQVWINNNLSKRLSHCWRNEIDAIMVGTTTALTDDPALTNRLWTGRSPVRVVLDRNAQLPENSKIFQGSAKTIAYTEAANIKGHAFREKVYRPLTFDDNMLSTLVMDLYKNDGVQSILVEGGAKLLASFLKKGLWNEARISRSSHNLGTGIVAPSITEHELGRHQLMDDEWSIYINNDPNA